MTTVIYRNSVDELAKEAVEILASAANRILLQQKSIVLAIPGGRSVQPLWKLLAGEKMPWDKVHIFMADERVVAPTHPDSNYHLAYESFLGRLIESGKMPQQNVHPFFPEIGSGSYYAELKKFGGKADIIILGVGEDGHVGALYPNHQSVKDDSESYIAMDDSPKPPQERVTMSRNLMLKAETALLFFIGEAKREAYEKFKSGDDATECPARLVRKIRNAYVLTDLK